MNRRIMKKKRKIWALAEELIQPVLEEVSDPLVGYEAPGYRGLLAALPEMTPVLVNTEDRALFTPETRRAVRKGGSRYCAYRMGPPERCLIFVSPVRYPFYFELSYNELVGEAPLARWRPGPNRRCIRKAEAHRGFFEDLLARKSREADLLREEFQKELQK